MVAEGRNVGCFTSLCWQAFPPPLHRWINRSLYQTVLWKLEAKYPATINHVGCARGPPSAPVPADQQPLNSTHTSLQCDRT